MNGNKSKNKQTPKTYLIAFTIFFCILAGLIYRAMTWNTVDSDSKKQSDVIIRRRVAETLGKDPNDLTELDFAQLEELTFMISRTHPFPPYKLSDISMLKQFTNMEELALEFIDLPVEKIPKWMQLLSKTGIIDLRKRFAVDLSPLKDLHNLQRLTLDGTSIVNIKPLANLKNLELLNFMSASITDIKPLKNLTQLEQLCIQNTQVSDIKPIKGLVNLKELHLSRTPVKDIEPLKYLVNLTSLTIEYAPICNLEPIKELTNLQRLSIENCPNITDDEIEDLQKALPNLIIYR